MGFTLFLTKFPFYSGNSNYLVVTGKFPLSHQRKNLLGNNVIFLHILQRATGIPCTQHFLIIDKRSISNRDNGSEWNEIEIASVLQKEMMATNNPHDNAIGYVALMRELLLFEALHKIFMIKIIHFSWNYFLQRALAMSSSNLFIRCYEFSARKKST